MLGNPCSAMAEKFCNDFKTYSPVQASGSISMSGYMGEQRFFNPAKLLNGLQVNVNLVIGYDGESEIVLFKDVNAIL